MYDMLVTFGDSWPKGEELKRHEKPFGQILSENLKCRFENYAVAGSCLETMVLELKKFISESYTFNSRICAIFFITSYHRGLLFDSQTQLYRSIYPMEDHSDPTVKNYFKYVYSDELSKFRANVAVLALQKICAEYNIDDKYFIGWIDPKFDYPGINKEKILPLSAAEILGISTEHECSTNSQHKYFYPNYYHPNQLGHKVLADWLLGQIEKNDIAH